MKKQQKPKEIAGFPVFTSVKQASGALGIPVARLKALKNAGCDGFKTSGRIHTGEIFTWLLKPRKAQSQTEPTWLDELRKVMAARQQVKLEKERGTVIDRRIAGQLIATYVAVMFSELERIFCAELPPSLTGLAPLEIKGKCEQSIEGLRNSLRAKFESITTDPE